MNYRRRLALLLMVSLALHYTAGLASKENASIPSVGFVREAGDKEVLLQGGTTRTKYVASGYSLDDFTPFKSRDGRPCISFLDLSGASSGGEMIVYCLVKELSKVPTNLSAAKLEKFSFGTDDYVCLLQHDSESYFFTSDIISVRSGTIVTSLDKNVWNVILKDYQAKQDKAASIGSASKYAGYRAFIYYKLGKNDLGTREQRQALTLDANNHFAQMLRHK